MSKKEPTEKMEVAHLTGVQGIRVAMEVLAREATARGEKGADRPAAGRMGAPIAEQIGTSTVERTGTPAAQGDGSSLPGTVFEEVPLGRRTCAVCAADNDGAREICWNCGASLRRAR